MAIDYQMGGANLAETEDERRRREAAELAQRQADAAAAAAAYSGEGAQADTAGYAALANLSAADAGNTEVKSQQVKTYADGSQEQVVKTQIPAAPEPAPIPAPAPIPVAAPVATMPVPAPVQTPGLQLPASSAVPVTQLPGAITGPAVPNQQMQMAAAPAVTTDAGQPGMGQVVPAGGQGFRLPPGAGLGTAPVNPAAVPAPMAAAPAAMPAAAPVNPAAAAAPQPAPQPAPAVATPTVTEGPVWASAVDQAGNDFGKLAAVAGQYPESGPIIKEKMQRLFDNEKARTSAEKTVIAAAQGDPRALRELQNAVRPDTGKGREEVTASDYIKAYLYTRLGLTELSRQVQDKIAGKNTKFGQTAVGPDSYSTEIDANTGQILRAWNEKGEPQSATTVSKIAAAGLKTGTQPYQFTGGISTVPSTGAPVQAQQNQATGRPQYVHMTNGIDAQGRPYKIGDTYAGNEIPQQQRITTQATVDYNRASINYKANQNTVTATELLKAAALIDPGDNSEINKVKQQIAQSLGLPSLQQILGGTAAPAAPTAAPATAAQAPVNPATATAAPAAAPAAAAGRVPVTTAPSGAIPSTFKPSVRLPGESLTAYTGRQEREKELFKSGVAINQARVIEENKPEAEAKGINKATSVNNQFQADEIYGLLTPVAALIKKSTGSGIGSVVDTLAAKFGKGTDGANAIAELNQYSAAISRFVPRFKGSDSDRDVARYDTLAGNFNNPAAPISNRLSSLKGMIEILKVYDKAKKNDWSYGAGGGSDIQSQADAILNKSRAR